MRHRHRESCCPMNDAISDRLTRLCCALVLCLMLPRPGLAQAPDGGDVPPADDTSVSNAVQPAGPLGKTRSELFDQSMRGGEATEFLGQYYDGVDGNNDLRVLGESLPVLNDNGSMQSTRFPCSPNFVDMNNDGLKDLVVGDSAGYAWIYINRGEKGSPIFTHGTFVQTFLGNGTKLHVTDWDGDADMDFVSGTFYGDIVFMENTGNKIQYNFVRSMGVPRYIFPRSGKPPPFAIPHLMMGNKTLVIGNYLSPWVADWNRDNKPDLIMGEGTYSANSIRFLPNQGSIGRMIFTSERMYYLAYGEGFEHLTPCVVDYNGDGNSDLIVGTRTGHFRMHKGSKDPGGASQVAIMRGTVGPAELEFDRFLNIEGKDRFGAMSIAYPCDWNADGLFDLLLGTQSGRIGLAINAGTKSEPSFPKVVYVKGVDLDKDLLGPAGWSVGYPANVIYCNSATLLSSVTDATCASVALQPKEGNRFIHFRYDKDYPGWVNDTTPGGRWIWFNKGARLEKGKKYEFSFQTAGVASGGPFRWQLRGVDVLAEATEDHNTIFEWRVVEDTFPASASWTKRTKTFACPLQTKLTNHFASTFSLQIITPPGDSELFLDDFSIKESMF